MHGIEMCCCLIIWPLSKILPVKSLPELAIALMFVCVFYMVEFIVMVMNVFSAYTGISHFIVGITLMVWGSDNVEMLNLAIATAKGQEEIGLTAVISAQVLCLTIVLPIACLARMHERD
jgi:Ca2+/Na+ antiporter